ncbi:hypothetical protein PHYPSEUDO_011874 [Phytophthora pseudosyringae]|uniref:Uncharacterized protein n=1 Tax=Phytophthora pseudosyringae TaxID=221518 RepID=A0A8T1VAJ9_9STRA|nr:hypothetical protein PHYPSEUDO_011874 [Phytophthora pseudosyringae]
MTKAQRKRAEARDETTRARELAAKYRQGKVSKFVSFDDVAALLDGPYSVFHSKPMVDALILPSVEVQGALTVKPFAVDQDAPVIKKIPQLPAILEAIDAIKHEANIDLLAY